VKSAVEGQVEHALLWRLLSLGFAAPTAERLDAAMALADVLADLDGSPPEVRELSSALSVTEWSELAADHATLFAGKVRVAPAEGSYELDPFRQGRQMADIAGFYAAFGAEPHGPASERPDHVGCELEFLSFLELRRSSASDEEDLDAASLADEIEASFLTDHAGRWLPRFFADVESEAGTPAVRAFARLGAHMVADELARRGIQPSEMPAHRPRLAVDADAFDCGDAA
jgi:TorA maturation chaperone TorD